tara:strand:+ start:4342 stop:4548 length:207 start_codon:yes stop_codon:yes gene_type:complete
LDTIKEYGEYNKLKNQLDIFNNKYYFERREAGFKSAFVQNIFIFLGLILNISVRRKIKLSKIINCKIN